MTWRMTGDEPPPEVKAAQMTRAIKVSFQVDAYTCWIDQWCAGVLERLIIAGEDGVIDFDDRHLDAKLRRLAIAYRIRVEQRRERVYGEEVLRFVLREPFSIIERAA